MGKKKRKTPTPGSVQQVPPRRGTPNTPAQPISQSGSAVQPRSNWRSVAMRAVRGFAAVLVFAVTILGGLSLFPRFSVSVGAPLLRNEILSFPMELSYDGYVPLNDLRARCDINFAIALP